MSVIKEVTLDNERDHRGGPGRPGGRSPFCVVTGRIGRGHLCEGLRSRQRKQQGPVRNRQETGVGGGLWWGCVFPDEAEEGDKSQTSRSLLGVTRDLNFILRKMESHGRF